MNTNHTHTHTQAFRLHQQLSDALQRRDEWREKDKETPQEERERLLKQVKADNTEIASIDKRFVQVYINKGNTPFASCTGQHIDHTLIESSCVFVYHYQLLSSHDTCLPYIQ